MRIDKMEIRNKKSGFMIKPCAFAQINRLTAEHSDDAWEVIAQLKMLRRFALGLSRNENADNIARVYFSANHHEYLWFSKTTIVEGMNITDDGQSPAEIVIVDEEEIYNDANEIILTRDFAEPTVGGRNDLPPMNQRLSMIEAFETAEAAEIRKAFGNIYTLNVTDAAMLKAFAAALPHGAVLMLDGRALAETIDLTTLDTDAQIFAVGHFSGGEERVVTKKGAALTVK